MRKTLFFFAFLGFWIQTMAQKYDKLIFGNDTTNCELKIAHKKGEIVVLFKKAYQTQWNEIYAENADLAIVSDKSLFVSLELPDIPKKVWTKCFFDGSYKLFQYREQFYIAESGKLTKLVNRKKEMANGKIFETKIFAGQMTQILQEKIEYDFSSLLYNSESLVLPLIKYHEKYQLPYHDYNDYVKTFLSWSISGGYSQEDHELLTQLTKPQDMIGYLTRSINMPGYSTFIAANMSLYFPKLSDRLFFSGGIEVSNPRIDALTVKSYTVESFENNTYYFNMSYRGMNLSAPVMAGFKLVRNNKLEISLETGFKVLQGFVLSQNLMVETEKENTVRTEKVPMESLYGLKFFHCSEVLVGIPMLSKSISLGSSYSYSLSNKTQRYTVSLDRSLLIFARYTY